MLDGKARDLLVYPREELAWKTMDLATEQRALLSAISYFKRLII